MDDESNTAEHPTPVEDFDGDAMVFTYGQLVEAVRFYGYGDKSCCKHNFMGLPTVIITEGRIIAGGKKAKDCRPGSWVFSKAQVEAAVFRAQRYAMK
jgi:hypothetical protein